MDRWWVFKSKGCRSSSTCPFSIFIVQPSTCWGTCWGMNGTMGSREQNNISSLFAATRHLTRVLALALLIFGWLFDVLPRRITLLPHHVALRVSHPLHQPVVLGLRHHGAASLKDFTDPLPTPLQYHHLSPLTGKPHAPELRHHTQHHSSREEEKA